MPSSNSLISVIFDLDGCLIDSSEGIAESIIYTLKYLGVYRDHLPMDNFIGPPIQESLKKYCGMDKVKAQTGAEIFRNYYKQNALFKAKVYDGILDLLNTLKSKNIFLGVATYKREDYAKQLLKKFQISDYLDTINGADNYNKLTKKDIIKNCLSSMHCAVDNTVMVGDTYHDGYAAEQAGMAFIGVTWGFGFKPNDIPSVQHLGMADNPAEILSILKC